LTEHSFGSKGGSNKENFFVPKVFLEGQRHINKLNFYANILLNANTFSLCAVMVSAWLHVELREDSKSFGVSDLVVCLQMVELPADKGIVVGVRFRRNKGAPPVSVHAKSFEVVTA
jgi:hypothetical protein